MQHIKSATNSRNEAYSDYLTTASYDELVAQIRNAGGVVNSEINTDKLDEILNSGEIANIDRDKYTDESLKSLDEAIENAKEVLANPNSSLEDIKNAADDVLEAIGNLEEKSSCVFRCSHGDQVPIRKNLREIGDFYIVHKLPFIPIPLRNYNLIFNVF